MQADVNQDDRLDDKTLYSICVRTSSGESVVMHSVASWLCYTLVSDAEQGRGIRLSAPLSEMLDDGSLLPADDTKFISFAPGIVQTIEILEDIPYGEDQDAG